MIFLLFLTFTSLSLAGCPSWCEYTPFDYKKGICKCTTKINSFNICPENCPYMDPYISQCVDKYGLTCAQQKHQTRDGSQEDITKEMCFCQEGNFAVCDVPANTEWKMGNFTGFIEYGMDCAVTNEEKYWTLKEARHNGYHCECNQNDRPQIVAKCQKHNKPPAEVVDFIGDVRCKDKCGRKYKNVLPVECRWSYYEFNYTPVEISWGCAYTIKKKIYNGEQIKAKCDCVPPGQNSGFFSFGTSKFLLDGRRQPNCDGCITQTKNIDGMNPKDDIQCQKDIIAVKTTNSQCFPVPDVQPCRCEVIISTDVCKLSLDDDVQGTCLMDGNTCYFTPTKGGYFNGSIYTQGQQQLCPSLFVFNKDCTCGSKGGDLTDSPHEDCKKAIFSSAGTSSYGQIFTQTDDGFSSQMIAIIIFAVVVVCLVGFWLFKKKNNDE